MATAYGSTINGYWRAYCDYTVTTDNAATYAVTCTMGIEIVSGSYATSTWSAKINATGYSETATSGTSKKGGSNTKFPIISNKVYSWSKGHSTATKNIAFSFTASGGTTAPGTSSKTFQVTVGLKGHYTITYDAAGGSGAPSSGTKWYNEAYTVSSTKPTMTGHTFSKWLITQTGNTVSPGGTITAGSNNNYTLEAIWVANTYKVSYNANGGTGSISAQTKTYGINLKLSNGAGFTRSLYSLTGWNTASGGGGTSYSLGGNYTGNANLTLYAQWNINYIKPVISNFVCRRVDSNGNDSDEGTYIKVSFNYKGGTTNGGSSYIAPNISVTINSTQKYSQAQSSGTGTFTQTFGTYTENTSHTVTVKAWDSNLTTGVTASATVPSATYPIDLLADGSAMGIMTTAVSGQKLKLFVDAIYPVGSYYETSDSSFNPNTYFGGYWVLETSGKVHVSAGTGYTIGSTGGSKDAIVPYHNHGFTQPTISSHSHKMTNDTYVVTTSATEGLARANVQSGSNTTYVVRSPGSALNRGGNTTQSEQPTASNGAVLYAGTSGNVTNANMQPYIVVNRWHRTG